MIGATCVAAGVFLAVLLSAAFHAPGGARLGVALAVLGVVLLVAAAVLRWIRGRRA